MNPHFSYHPAIIARYPALVGAVILAEGVQNGPSAPVLLAAYAEAQAEVKARIGATPLSELPTLAAWRAAFRAFGVDPTQYRCAAEALLRRLTKQGDIPSINMLVDVGNLVSIRYGLPVAVFDRAQLAGALTVRFADGDEAFTDLGKSAPENPAAGEVVFNDAANAVHARRWCWRQSAQSAAQPTTTTALITIEAHHPDARADVQAAAQLMLTLLAHHAGGQAALTMLPA